MLTKKEITEYVSIGKLITDPTRLKLLDELFHCSNGNVCVNDLASKIGCSQSAASHQLAKLSSLNIIQPIRLGQTRCYKVRINPFTKKLNQVLQLLKK